MHLLQLGLTTLHRMGKDTSILLRFLEDALFYVPDLQVPAEKIARRMDIVNSRTAMQTYDE